MRSGCAQTVSVDEIAWVRGISDEWCGSAQPNNGVQPAPEDGRG